MCIFSPEMVCLAELIGAAMVNASDAAAISEETSIEAEEVNADVNALPNSPIVLAANEAAKRAMEHAEKTQLLALEVCLHVVDCCHESGINCSLHMLFT